MDFIDSSAAAQEEASLVFCPSCGFQMLFVTKGELTGNYICQMCGMTIDSRLEDINQDDEITIKSEEESTALDSLIMVQKDDDDRPISSKVDDWINADIKRDIERGGRKQVISISNGNGPAAFASGTSSNNVEGSKLSRINRIERPK